MSDAIRVSPSARLLAAEKGIDLASIRGTGPNGRIVRADIDAASEGAPPPPPASAPVAAAAQSSSDDRIKASPLAKRIAAEQTPATSQPASTPDKSKRMARALALRVGFSVLLFLCILLAWKLGFIQPTGIPPGR